MANNSTKDRLGRLESLIQARDARALTSRRSLLASFSAALALAAMPALAAPRGGKVGRLRADLLLCYKQRRALYLLHEGAIQRQYRVALGFNPIGHKIHRGDGRTPEGIYLLDWRNPNSQFHRSINISYPNEADKIRADRMGVDPGSLIMLHGLRNGRSASVVGHPNKDWTDGCLGVFNHEIDEIWDAVEDGTPIILIP